MPCLQKATSGKGENKSCLLDYKCISNERALKQFPFQMAISVTSPKLIGKAAI